MKHYKDNDNNVYAYEDDGSQDHLIGDKILMTAEEVEEHINPPKTEEQILKEQIQEVKLYLSSTDFKMTVDYYNILTDEEKVELTTKRAEARAFLKAQGL